MGTWLNDDTLYIKYGNSEATSSHKAGTVAGVAGQEHCSIISLDWTLLTATETVLNDSLILPAGALITHVRSTQLIAAATGTAVDLGLITASDRTENDYDGLWAAHTAAAGSDIGEVSDYYPDAAGAGTIDTILDALTLGGAAIGFALTENCYVSASTTTGTAFTTGESRVEIFWVPSGLTK